MTEQATAFVRHTPLPPSPPPASQTGMVKWLRENLFSSVFNAILTVLALYFIYKILAGFIPWMMNGVWNTSSIAECYAVLDGKRGGCFSVLTERWHQLIFGFKYPSDQYWRPSLSFILLLISVAPVLFSKLPRKMLLITAIYPFLAYWLIWGGTVIVPLIGLLGFVGGFKVFQATAQQKFAVGFFAATFAALLIWYLGSYLGAPLSNFIALEAVPSRDMGGFMLNIILGTVCVSLSVPLGILLALGRQSDLPVIRVICVVFIEFIRGVPLITLLFVANVVLAYFLPPGTNFDLILRVIIMITLFSAAYIAEVIRGGLAALPTGQYEAAGSLGLDYAQSMRLIILPQALKISIPGIVNVAVGLFKDTTLVSIISMFDLVGMIRGPILASTEWNGIYWELLGFAAVLFFIVCYGISQYSQWLERQLATDNR
jgi:general L-amino acid transport system permease protein